MSKILVGAVGVLLLALAGAGWALKVKIEEAERLEGNYRGALLAVEGWQASHRELERASAVTSAALVERDKDRAQLRSERDRLRAVLRDLEGQHEAVRVWGSQLVPAVVVERLRAYGAAGDGSESPVPAPSGDPDAGGAPAPDAERAGH